MTANGGQTVPQQQVGFWKIRHAVIGLGVLGLITLLLVRGCGEDAEDEPQAEAGDASRQAVAVQVPAGQRPGQYPAAQQPYGAPGYAPQQPAYGYQQQQPAYAYPQQQPGYSYQQQPAYGAQSQQPAYGYQPQQPVYGTQPQQPAYGYQQQPAYGYGQQGTAPQPQYPVTDPDNPWAARLPGYGQQTQTPQWGQQQRQAPVYIIQVPGGSQYRPLDDQAGQSSRSSTAPAAPPTWGARPYDRRGGTSFGNDAAAGGYPYGGVYGGYYGAPYGLGTWPGGYGSGWPATGYPGVGWPGIW